MPILKKITGARLINHKSQVQRTTELGVVTMNWGIRQGIDFGLNIPMLSNKKAVKA